MGTNHPVDRSHRTYLRMLGGILLTYALIIGFGDTVVGDPVRVAIFGWLLWTALRQHGSPRYRWWSVGGTAIVVAVCAVGVLTGSPRVASGIVGACTLVMVSALATTIASTLWRRGREVDTVTVLGVLCIYLLLALQFAAVHQVCASVSQLYVNGAPQPPSASDLLYFSVITMTTVGFGDITPASEVARAVTVVEALTGQLYLVSVVAAVVGGWRGRRAGSPPPA